ncbi:uncharacterized protein LOC129582344 [Paramacrobiotus metropolitanus]|uniref:uncharacterized protein LOC129582344 n=1 Tax=Paramacrobiotus metropolitanus TaxID=2943436 RepID=UPI002445843E|nr:uncharacterized protein LOC129582344 [Paramacrobiotus metropolitanus]
MEIPCLLLITAYIILATDAAKSPTIPPKSPIKTKPPTTKKPATGITAKIADDLLTTQSTTVNEMTYPRRTCVCDIGIINHVMLMPVHEKSRPLKNCAVAVEYCKQMCVPAVVRQILGFRGSVNGKDELKDVPLSIKPFWEAHRTLGEALCQSLGKETGKPLELAVYAQAKSCGRRIQAVNGTFPDRLCCQLDGEVFRSSVCPEPITERTLPTTVPTTTLLPTTPLTSKVTHKKKGSRTRGLTVPTTSRRRTTTTTTPVTSTMAEPGPEEAEGDSPPGSGSPVGGGGRDMMPEPSELRSRTALQFRRFMHMLRSPAI